MLTVKDAFIVRVKQLMKDKRFTKHKLSIESAIPNSTIHNFLEGTTKSTGIENLVNICRGLNVSLSEFFATDLFLFENMIDD